MSNYKESFNKICKEHTCNTCPLENDDNDNYSCYHEGFYKFGYQQGRADAIEELMQMVKDIYGYDYYSDLIQIADQVKEQR